MGWSPIHHACDSRRGTQRLTELLREGLDPASATAFGETPLQICALADAAQGALPEDAAMTALLRLALKPWHPQRHVLFPRAFAARVVPLLLLCQRHEQRQVQVRLTRETWLKVVAFLPRFRQAECTSAREELQRNAEQHTKTKARRKRRKKRGKNRKRAGSCAHCGEAAQLRCARCKAVAYCSSKCQKAHWHAGHRAACSK